MTIAIDAIKTASLWSIAHIGVEILELTPSLADNDASSTVILKGSLSRILAATQHGTPDAVRGAIGLAMSSASSRGKLDVEATATLRPTKPQVVTENGGFICAITTTQPLPMTGSLASIRQHYKAPVTFASHVYGGEASHG
jgi:hypothetical protein